MKRLISLLIKLSPIILPILQRQLNKRNNTDNHKR